MVMRRPRRAAIHSILLIAYHILREGVAFQNLGADYFDRMNAMKAKRYHLRRLEELGCDVSKITAAYIQWTF
jgi:transposase